MANYLRPRRGRRRTAIKQNLILKRGELFMEYPEAGPGTGAGKIMIGDGVTEYGALPYFLDGSIFLENDFRDNPDYKKGIAFPLNDGSTINFRSDLSKNQVQFDNNGTVILAIKSDGTVSIRYNGSEQTLQNLFKDVYDKITINANNIKTNPNNIKTNANNIKTNANNIKTNANNIDANKKAISKLNSDLAALTQKFNTHNHDDRYYTKSYIDSNIKSLQNRIKNLEGSIEDLEGSIEDLEGYYKDLKGSISNLDFVTKDQLNSAIYNAKEELKTATQDLVTLSLKTYLGIQWSMFPNSATETFNVKRPGVCAIGIIGVDCENYNNVHYCNLHLYVSADHSVQEVHTRVVDANGNKVSNAGVRFGILYMASSYVQ